jgi:hypothetical protein
MQDAMVARELGRELGRVGERLELDDGVAGVFEPADVARMAGGTPEEGGQGDDGCALDSSAVPLEGSEEGVDSLVLVSAGLRGVSETHSRRMISKGRMAKRMHGYPREPVCRA